MISLPFFSSKELWAALLGGIAGGLAAVFAVLLAARKAVQTVAESELRRARFKALSDLVAHRAFLLPGAASVREHRAPFFVALNSLVVLFGDHPDVLVLLRRLRDAPTAGKNKVLLELIRACASAAGIPLKRVKDADLLDPFHHTQEEPPSRVEHGGRQNAEL